MPCAVGRQGAAFLTLLLLRRGPGAASLLMARPGGTSDDDVDSAKRTLMSVDPSGRPGGNAGVVGL